MHLRSLPAVLCGENFLQAAKLVRVPDQSWLWGGPPLLGDIVFPGAGTGGTKIGLHPEIAMQADDLPLDPPGALISGFRVSTRDPAPMYGAFSVRIVRNVRYPGFQQVGADESRYRTVRTADRCVRGWILRPRRVNR
jgi:hypothetical protein